MGKLSGIFTNVKNGFSGYKRTAYFNRTRNKNRDSMKKGGYNAGYGAVTFRNIIDAHSDADEIVQEFGLDQEDAAYGNCYQRAYKECYAQAVIEMMMAMDFTGDPEDYIDWDELEELAYEYAIELAEDYISGQQWIPQEIIDWAYYSVSSHNG